MSWLVVCCDGTWSTPDMASVTNVRRLYNLLDDVDAGNDPQQSFYGSGVGTTGSAASRLEAGAFGTDLDEKILEAYRWLVTHYSPGDEIALFGFSRGAYTVRSLSGMIATCGIVDPAGLDAAMLDDRITRAYEHGYREQRPDWRDDIELRYDPDSDDIPVRFIGVWDTVGALGIPANLEWLRPERRDRYTFHDVELDRRIPAARHAVAIDEMRGPFTPTLWDETELAPGQDVEQVWFAGSHLDVGGGHVDRGLADITLEWMLDEVGKLTSIGVVPAGSQIVPDPLAVVHEDNDNQFGPGVSLLLDPSLDRWGQLLWDSRPRAIPVIDAGRQRADVHGTVYARQQGRPITGGRYRPTRVLESVGDTATVDVPARDPWTDAGLYLMPGRYEFTGDGEWRDGGDWLGPQGTVGPGLNPLTLVGGAFALAFRTTARVWTGQGHPEWTFFGERRRPTLPRMRLVGVVANDDGPAPAPGVATHQVVDVGRGQVAEVDVPGYLYAYANDAWSSYDDNAGSVRLTVTKVR
ncbi:DUF2235 domain-containing protein [Actinomycetospora endophytica]|uniref:DUF2235 domain-containing protein n=1 Tax=Actinomycetospora endophytica TaxID=2291215 RepID=A0ABS8PD54_9PSEU|nr:DUF2235 domain-containing protein [Actinomycetospora endophytica]MCD2196202.1 DUF2235 domain-containing protein [Actinomycetospora endophytica]